MALTKTQISELYVSIFNRASEKSGSQNWLNSGYNTDAIAMANKMLEEDAAIEYFGTSLLTDKAFVDHIYKNTLNKGEGVDEAGKAVWVEFLATGASRGEMVVEMIKNIKDYQVGGAKYATADQVTKDAAQQFANRVEVSDYTADTLETIAVSEIDSTLSFSSALTVTANPATIDSAKAAVDAANPANVGKTFTLTNSATPDTLIGTSRNDTFTGDATTYSDADQIIDVSTTDADTYNLTVSAAATPKVTNVENINVNMNSVSAIALDASSIVGAKTVTVTRGDLTIAGATVTGNKAVSVINADSTNMTTIVAGAGATSMNVDAAATDKAGLTIDASVVTQTVTVDGAATVNADNAVTSVSIDAVTNTDTTETAKATVINAAKAATVSTHADLTGSVTINAAAATNVTVSDAQGGATVTAGTTSTADTTITVVDVDASGVTIVTGTGSSVAAEKEIDIVLDGTAATTDAATISANGTIDLDIDGTNAAVDVLTLSGNGADVTYRLAAPTAGTFTSMTKAGSNSVTVSGDASEFSATTISGIDVITLNAIAGGAAAFDASKFTNVGNVNIGVDNANSAFTVNSDTKWTLTTATQTTGLDFDFATGSANGNLTIVSGDVNGSTNAAVGTATVNTFNAAAGATVVGNVTLEAFESNFTATSTVLGAKQNLIITGDEDVTLGAVTADSVDATASTGIISLTMAANVDKVTTGSGADLIVLNGASKHTVSTGSGNDTITVTDTNSETSIDAGDGDDTINANDNDKVYVVAGGAGDDTLNVGFVAATGDLDAYFIGGTGTDTLVFTVAGANDISADEFSMSGIEKINLTALNNTLTISAAQFANNNVVQLIAVGGDDTFAVTGGTTAATIDASGVTVASGSTVTIQYTGSTKADVITGGVAAETFIQSLGADSIVGGSTGTDTYQVTASLQETGSTEAATGMVVNLGSSAITGTQVYAGITKHLGEGAVNVAANSVAYAYASADSSTINNSAVVDSISGIENVIGSAMADYIVGDANNNTITGGAGIDYLTGGDGADTFVFATADIDTTAGAVTDRISDFSSAAGDKLSLGAAGDAGTNYSEAGAAVADLATLLTAADSALDGTVKYYLGQVTGGASYLVIDTDGNGYTDVIELTGVTLATFAATDIIA